jgi:hypothetical protein
MMMLTINDQVSFIDTSLLLFIFPASTRLEQFFDFPRDFPPNSGQICFILELVGNLSRQKNSP